MRLQHARKSDRDRPPIFFRSIEHQPKRNERHRHERHRNHFAERTPHVEIDQSIHEAAVDHCANCRRPRRVEQSIKTPIRQKDRRDIYQHTEKIVRDDDRDARHSQQRGNVEKQIRIEDARGFTVARERFADDPDGELSARQTFRHALNPIGVKQKIMSEGKNLRRERGLPDKKSKNKQRNAPKNFFVVNHQAQRRDR